MALAKYLTETRAGVGLTILLACSSCMPKVGDGGATRAAKPLASATGTADPSPSLLRPPGVAAAGFRAIAVAPPFVAIDATSEATARATECLTAAVYYEARSEPRDGQRAVAQVVLNRVRNPAFPASVCGVVYQRAGTNRGCQFSFACDGSTLLPRDPAAWSRARRIATEALAGSVYAPAGAATFYHTTSVSPWWAKSVARVATIGAHIFYRLGDGWRGALDFRQGYAGMEPAGRAAEVDDRLATIDAQPAAHGRGEVVVHAGTKLVAGVVVHRGTGDVAPSEEVTSAVRVHVGAMPDGPDAIGTAG